MPEALGSGKQHASAAVMLSHCASCIFPQNGMIRTSTLVHFRWSHHDRVSTALWFETRGVAALLTMTG
jgi:hypothetical protein